MNETERTRKVAALIKEQTAHFIAKEANTDPLITITNVGVSRDLTRATIYFTTFPTDRENDALIFLQRNAGLLREHLKTAHILKRIPHIECAIDHGERHRQHIDEVARDIEKK